MLYYYFSRCRCCECNKTHTTTNLFIFSLCYFTDKNYHNIHSA